MAVVRSPPRCVDVEAGHAPGVHGTRVVRASLVTAVWRHAAFSQRTTGHGWIKFR